MKEISKKAKNTERVRKFHLSNRSLQECKLKEKFNLKELILMQTVTFT